MSDQNYFVKSLNEGHIEAILALEVKNVVVGSKIKIKDQNHRYFYLQFFGVLGAAGTSPLKALKNRIIYKELRIRHPTSCTNYFLYKNFSQMKKNQLFKFKFWCRMITAGYLLNLDLILGKVLSLKMNKIKFERIGYTQI